MQDVIVIRNRYQITIPESIREGLSWLVPGAVMRVLSMDNRLMIQPYRAGIAWDDVWKAFNTVAQKGKNISLSKFVTSDRLSH